MRTNSKTEVPLLALVLLACCVLLCRAVLIKDDGIFESIKLFRQVLHFWIPPDHIRICLVFRIIRIQGGSTRRLTINSCESTRGQRMKSNRICQHPITCSYKNDCGVCLLNWLYPYSLNGRHMNESLSLFLLRGSNNCLRLKQHGDLSAVLTIPGLRIHPPTFNLIHAFF